MARKILSQKKGLESVEVWMWLIAGMVLGTMIFVSSYTMLSKYIHNNEISQAQTNFNLLKSSVDRVCFGGFNTNEIKTYTFPYITKNIRIIDDNGFEEVGKKICYTLEKEDEVCTSTPFCNVEMDTINLDLKSNVFYLVQKALKKKKAANIEFTITKTGRDVVKIEWKRVIEK